MGQAIKDQPSVFKGEKPAAVQGSEIEVMGHHEDGLSLISEMFEDGKQIGCPGWVQVGCRFIQQHDGGILGQDLGQQDPGELTNRQGRHGPRGEIYRPDLLQGCPGRLVVLAAERGKGRAMGVSAQEDKFGGADFGNYGGALGQEGYGAAAQPRWHAVGGFALELHRAPLRAEPAGE